MEILVPFLVVATLATVVLTLAMDGVAPAAKRAIWVGLALRMALAIAFTVFPEARLFHDDADGYEAWGLALSRHWHGEGPPLQLPPLNYGFMYVSAALMYVVGPFRVLPSLFNCLVGTLAPLIIYRSARSVFDDRVALRALRYSLYFPSMILWSSIAMKDPLMILLLASVVASVIYLQKTFSLRVVLVVVIALVSILTLRFYMFYMAGGAVLLSLTLLSSRQSRGRSVLSQVLISAILIGAFLVLGLRQEAQDNLSFIDLKKVSVLRSGLGSTSNSAWMADADVSTPGAALLFMPLGVLFVLFAPFPWQFSGLRAILTLPEMLVWWALTPAWWRGLRYVLAAQGPVRNFRPLLTFTAVIAVAYSTVHGNVGVAFRQRSQVMLYLFVLGAIGHYVRRLERVGASPDAVLRSDATPAMPVPAAPSPPAISASSAAL